MKKIIFIICLLILFLHTHVSVNATTGGPTYVHDFYYREKDDKVLFLNSYLGGGSCLILYEIDIATEDREVIFSCEDIRKMEQEEGNDLERYYDYIPQKVVSYLKKDTTALREVNLQKLGGKIEFKLGTKLSENEHKGKNRMPYILHDFSNLQWDVIFKIKEETIKTFDIFECFIYGTDSNIRAYGLPGDNFLILVVTKIGNCSEYGYFDEAIALIKDIDLSSAVFLQDVHNPIAPKGISEDEFCCPLGTKVFPSPKGILVNIPKVSAQDLNNAGYRAYESGDYVEAMGLFDKALYLDSNYLMPLFNLAATQSKVGIKKEALINARRLILADKEKAYIQKIFKDPDFNNIRLRTYLLILLHERGIDIKIDEVSMWMEFMDLIDLLT